MNIKRRKAGFTMAEMLIVVAIIVVLAAVAFIGVQAYLRSMTQLEYDAAAKEIFVAAQNHLSMAHSLGYLGLEDTSGAFGTQDTSTLYSTNKNVRYFIVTNGSSVGDNTKVLGLMLPFGSIDATVLGGNYIIRYDMDTGTVMDVFYSGSTDSSGFNLARFGRTFSEAQYAPLMNKYRDTDSENHKNDRRTCSVCDNGVVGWYGNEQAKNLPKVDLKAPTIEVINAEKLTVRVNNTNPDMTDGTSNGLNLVLIITGKTSKAVKRINLINNNMPVAEYGSAVQGDFNVVLDDVTQSGKHFCEICSDHFPGEDIEIEAVLSSETKLAPVVSSGKRSTNSLFGNGTVIKETESPAAVAVETAMISNFRHLENMSPAISNISTTDSEPHLVEAKQTTDLNWQDFMSTIRTLNSVTNVTVYNKDHSSNSENNTYMPVNPELPITYDGQNHSITGVEINVTGSSAGLFGELSASTVSTVKDLELIDFKVSGTNAGALAGVANADITNVFVHNTLNAAATLEISGSGSVGGLVGDLTGGNVLSSAAALYVKSTGGAAGGLIGSVSGANSNISNSYAGGHTKDGKYLDTDSGSNTGRVNVIGATAGGLIGTFSGTKIENCYSTCSVSGSTAAGGFIGNATAGTVSKSYCTGLVVGNVTKDTEHNTVTPGTGHHAFLGTGSSTEWSGNNYYSIINDNYYTDDLGPGTESAAAFDATLASYNDFCPKSTMKAQPYDAQLALHYQNQYPFRAIKNLDSNAPAEDVQLVVHYGDWPEAETKVENTKNS